MADKKGFDLAKVLGSVSNLDTGSKPGREQIEYIDIDLIDADDRNFYELSGIEELASNIQLVGLQQPLRVRDGEDGHVITVSGHRRRAAMQLLVDEGLEQFRQVPCIRSEPISDEKITEMLAAADASGERILNPDEAENRNAIKSLMSELALIYGNSDTRHMTSPELSRQAERMEMLLYQLKEAGIEFPGRMRDHVAEACRVSKSKLARLKVIRENLNSIWTKAYDSGDLNESCAYALAKLPQEYQRSIFLAIKKAERSIKYLGERDYAEYGERLATIDKITCPKQGDIPCTNSVAMKEKALSTDRWSANPCRKCCSKCDNLVTCKSACPMLADKVKQLKEEKRERNRQVRAEITEIEAPEVEKITAIWQRVSAARLEAGKSIEEIAKLAMPYVPDATLKAFVGYDAGSKKITASSQLPFGNNIYISDIERFVAVADALNVSLDYLFGRTDDPEMHHEKSV